MAQVQPGDRARARKARQAHIHGASIGVSQTRAPAYDASGMSQPPAWAEAWSAAQAVGDVRALQATPMPSMDYLCGKNAEGIQGKMFCQGGVCFCRFA
jgi:hypothetical protein